MGEAGHSSLRCTVVPVMNGHPRDQAKVSVHCRWRPLIRGNLTLKCVGRGIDNVAVQGRWLLTTVVAQGRYYCTATFIISFHWSLLLAFSFNFSFSDLSSHNPPILAVVFLVFCNLLASLSQIVSVNSRQVD